MERMKYDMSGAAAVLGALGRLRARRSRHRHHSATVENMPSGTAIKPGDVLLSMAGKSIEVVNTDAEGRLILADALAYAAELDPDCIVDIATLTGAGRIALGSTLRRGLNNDARAVGGSGRAGRRGDRRAGRGGFPQPGTGP